MRLCKLTTADDPDVRPDFDALARDADPWAARKGRMLLELIHHLELADAAPEVFAHRFIDELWLFSVNPEDRVQVRVAAVWRDYGPVRDGLPELHYRMTIKHAGEGLSRETRWKDPAEIARAIGELLNRRP